MSASPTDYQKGQGPTDSRNPQEAVALVDFANIFPDLAGNEAQLVAGANRVISYAVERDPQVRRIDIRLYGGWLDDGTQTKHASQLAATLGRVSLFPMRHPSDSGVLRGDISLVTRLARLPSFEWGHTLRHRTGTPHVKLARQPYPDGCVHESPCCPVRAFHRFAKSRAQVCAVAACDVTNRGAFSVPEQKMVDTLLCCDALEYARRGVHVIVMSSDLDVLPGVAAAASDSPRARVSLVRSARYSAGLYKEELKRLGVLERAWDDDE